jgi:hypothetical protein
MSYDAGAHCESLRLQDSVIRHLQSAGVPARMEFPGYLQIGSRAFLHWHKDSRWLDEKGTTVGEANHQDAAEVADAILKILKK